MPLVNVIDSVVITEERDISKVLAEWAAFDPDITTYGQLTSGQAVKLFINWSDKNGTTTLYEGDYFTFVVPDIFRQNSVTDVTDIAIKTPLGEIVATYSIYDNGDNKKEVKLAFTDYVETHTDIFGDLWLLLFVGNVETTEIKPFDFVINGDLLASGEISTTPPPSGYATPFNNKDGHSALGDIYNGYYIFNWNVRLNMDADPVNGFNTVENFRFEDVIPTDSPHVFLTDEIRQQLGLNVNDFPLRIGEYEGADLYPPQDRYDLLKYQYNSSGVNLWTNYVNYVALVNGYTSAGIDGGEGLKVSNLVIGEKSLSADLGRLTRPTSIQYCTIATVKIAESALGDSEVVKLFTNTFKANYGDDITSSLIIHRFESGGSAQGLEGDCSFTFTKVNEKGAALEGVLFLLYTSPDFSTGAERFVYSNSSGVVTFENLPEGVYYLLETATPSGYVTNDTIYRVNLNEEGFEIYYGETFENKLSDYNNKIVNKFQAAPSVFVTLTGRKILTGKTLTSGMFSFIIKDSGGITAATGTNDASGSINFSQIEFNSAGEYIFTVEEIKGVYSGTTYDSSKFTVTVLITEDQLGNLYAQTAYPAGGIVFNNTYSQVPFVNPCKCTTCFTKCRQSIKSQKIWIDNDNAYGKRPSSVEIILKRNGEVYKTSSISAAENWAFTFVCLPVWKNTGEKYYYQIDETAVAGYSKSINGYNITNTLDKITINCTKTWNDNHNQGGIRPATISVNLLQNGNVISSVDVTSPQGTEDTSSFSFDNVPFADGNGKPFVYTVDENKITGYNKTVNGFNIINTLITGGFSFSKTSTATGLSLQGAVFEIRKTGALIATSASDPAGKVYFSNLIPGMYLMTETISPVGYMSNTTVYDVVVFADGTVTIDGLPADKFNVTNTPEAVNILLERATAVTPAYMAAPNTWPLNGTTQPDLYMLDRIFINLPYTPVLVKWAYGIQNAAYFRAGGGINITTTYQGGIPAPLNTVYTVYALFGSGIDAVASITIDRVRDGSAEMPYLLIDFTTADTLEPFVTGINQFTLYYMQGGGIKLTQHYEIYESIDMDNKLWEPLGTLSPSYPYPVTEGFTGSLQGNGHDIINLALGSPERSEFAIALFRGIIDGAIIKDLGLINYSAEANSRVGGFVCIVNVLDGKSVLLKNLRFSGVLKSNSFAGGIVCDARFTGGSLIIDGCTINASVNANECSAAILGYCNVEQTASLLISGCHSLGSMSVLGRASGIIGLINSNSGGQASILNCVNDMTLNGPVSMGGMIGSVSHNGTAVISVSSCCNFGNITGNDVIGGIVGVYSTTNSTFTGLTIDNCYNGGIILLNERSGNLNYGGIMGYANGNAVIQNNYNTGNVVFSPAVSNNLRAGGIIGRYGTVKNCAVLCELVSSSHEAARISSFPVSAGISVLDNNAAFDNMQVLINGVQKSPLDTGTSGTDGISVSMAEIKSQALYENTLGWNFTNTWSFGNGGYTLPVLRGIPASLQPTVLPPHLV